MVFLFAHCSLAWWHLNTEGRTMAKIWFFRFFFQELKNKLFQNSFPPLPMKQHHRVETFQSFQVFFCFVLANVLPFLMWK